MIEGKKAFGDAIHSEEYLSTIKAYGAFVLFAVPVYRKLGFEETGDVKENVHITSGYGYLAFFLK